MSEVAIAHHRYLFESPILQQLLAINRDALSYFTGYIRQDLDDGKIEDAVSKLSYAAMILPDCGRYVFPELEELLIRAGTAIFSQSTAAKQQIAGHATKKPHVIHITTEVCSTGGHTEALCNWIRNDRNHCYSVLVTSQQDKVPEKVSKCVEASGGSVLLLENGLSTIEKAQKIRSIVGNTADLIVLQLYADDISGLLPFCVKGGPPVIVYNTADHLPWLGVRLTDRIFEIRNSGFSLTQSHRGCDRASIVPLFIPAKPISKPDERRAARSRLGLLDQHCVLLTVGRAIKYRPSGELNFLEVMREVVNKCEHVVLLGVGPEDAGDWRRLNNETNGRIRAYGLQDDLRDFHGVADIYVEGFPFGSLTALLEARDSGLPCVLAPLPVIPPFMSDSPGIADLRQPASLKDYVAEVLNLISNRKQNDSERVVSTQMTIHRGIHWAETLQKSLLEVPENHSTYELTPLNWPTPPLETYWYTLRHSLSEIQNGKNTWTQVFHKLGITDQKEEMLREFADFAMTSITKNGINGQLRFQATQQLRFLFREAGIRDSAYVETWRQLTRLATTNRSLLLNGYIASAASRRFFTSAMRVTGRIARAIKRCTGILCSCGLPLSIRLFYGSLN